MAGASVFASSGGGEAPSLTIEALGIRAGDPIRKALMRREARSGARWSVCLARKQRA